MSRPQQSQMRSAAHEWRTIAAPILLMLLVAAIVGQFGLQSAMGDDEFSTEPTRRFGPYQPQPDTVIWKTPDGHDCGPEALARGSVSPAYISPPWLYWGWGGYLGYGYGWGWGYRWGGWGYGGFPGYPNVWPYRAYYDGYFNPYGTGVPWPY